MVILIKKKLKITLIIFTIIPTLSGVFHAFSGSYETYERIAKYGNFMVGIGGSATNDAGMGMARALGFKFYDKNGVEIHHGTPY